LPGFARSPSAVCPRLSAADDYYAGATIAKRPIPEDTNRHSHGWGVEGDLTLQPHRDASGAFRIIYVTTFGDAVYVLHAFQKKTQKTSQRDVNLAAERFRELTRRKER